MLLPDFSTIFFIAAVLGWAAELSLVFSSQLKKHLSVIILSIFLTMFSAGLIVSTGYWWLGLIFILISVYRCVNLLRLIELRIDPKYLNSIFRRTSLYLFPPQIICAALLIYGNDVTLKNGLWSFLAVIAGCLTLFVAGILFFTTFSRIIKASRSSGLDKIKRHPTVSVLIPARNETKDLAESLDSLLQSTYPKLEIIVLDDCSRDKTPEIIRGYANKGIRFMSGGETPDRWLSKNYAYHQLAKEASGEILLFIGVDVRFSESSIELLVNEFLKRKLVMLGVLPKRAGQSILGAVVQPMRYWLEIALPTFINRHPPVLSTCWLIDHKVYLKFGGMEAVSRTIIPENYFAKKANSVKGYFFIRSHHASTVTTIKNVSEQIDTAVRTRYPQVKRRPERVLLLGLFEIFFLLMPYVITIFGLFTELNASVWWLAFGSTIILSASHFMITYLTNPGVWMLSMVSFPLIVLVEFILLHASMYKYEFGTVNWKGRNVCLPVVQVIASLPKIK